MHFDNKLAESPAVDLECALDVFVEGHDVPSVLNREEPRAPVETLGTPSDEAASASCCSEVPRAARASFGFYNLVKSCAKEDPAVGVQSLAVQVQSAGRDVDGKNSKGSTGLHACAYLKRWDLAQVLLDAGADPLSKNAAGHSFFLTAVKDPGAPWETLFEKHPELQERHRKFLAKGTGRSRSEAGRRSAPKAKILVPQSDVPSISPADGAAPAAAPRRPTASAAPPLLAAALASEDWATVGAELAEGGVDLAQHAVPAEQLLAFAKHAPASVLALLHGASLSFSSEARIVIARRALDPDWPDGVDFWMDLGRGIDPAEQEAILNLALREKKIEVVSELTQRGWRFGEDFIENCEEAGHLDLADDLIDLQATFKVASPTPKGKPAQKPDGAKGKKRADAGKTAKKKKGGGSSPNARQKSAGNAGRQRGGAAGSARRSAMIANLDGPVREANEFEYKDRKPAAAATIIIVKKARSIVPQEP